MCVCARAYVRACACVRACVRVINASITAYFQTEDIIVNDSEAYMN